jgi:hypothetical protein
MPMTTQKPTPRPNPDIAKRALAEAGSRKAEIDARMKNAKPETAGRGGLDPARYGDWEVKGISSDF